MSVKRIIRHNPSETDPSWYEGLKGDIYNVITPMALPSESLTEDIINMRLKLVNSEAMEIWKIAFTHKSYNKNINENNEVLEHFGDKVLSLVFDKYLITKYPTITESEASELITSYMSKEFQSELGLSLGLDKWIRISVDKNMHIYEDLFESIFGALFQIGDKIFKPGYGYIMCYNMIVQLFENRIKIDFKRVLGDVKTQVKNIFEKLHWITKGIGIDELGVPIQQEDKSWRLTLKLTQASLVFLKQNYPKLNFNPVLADVNEKGKPTVIKEGFKKALESLENMGITTEWATNVNKMQKMQQSEIREHWTKAYKKMEEDGYVDIEFDKPRKGELVTYVQLLGIRNDGYIDILVTLEDKSAKNIEDLKARALIEYYSL